MFTGIITNTGKVLEKTGSRLKITSDKKFHGILKKGLSVSVNGICLTVVSNPNDFFEVDFMPETFDKTNIRYLQKGDIVNLEFSAKPDSFLSGWIVQGHVDTIVKIIEIKDAGNSKILKLGVDKIWAKYIVKKGPVTLNGISLTVIDVHTNFFTVGIIPYTLNNTNLKIIKKGDYLNLETDLIAKYIEKIKI